MYYTRKNRFSSPTVDDKSEHKTTINFYMVPSNNADMVVCVKVESNGTTTKKIYTLIIIIFVLMIIFKLFSLIQNPYFTTDIDY